MRRIGIEERRARLALRHHLAPDVRAARVEEAARGMVCLHATNSSSVYLAAWARVGDLSMADVDRALYEDRTLVRMLAMRRTVFAVPVEDVPIVQAAASTGVARLERRRTEAMVAQLGVPSVSDWLAAAEEATLTELDRRGEATAAELARAVPMLAARALLNPGQRLEGNVSMASRVLLTLAVEGRIARGRPRGTWVSNQYRWTTTERWLGGPIERMPVAESQALLARRWLARFGPAMEADLAWWTGWTLRDTRAALAATGAIEVALDDGQPGFVLADDVGPAATPEPWVALLPTLDPTTMGWKSRDWYLGTHRAAIFDSAGNAGPTIWAHGRIVGGWAFRPNGDVVRKLLEDVGRDAEAAILAEAERLRSWVADSGAPAPRFPSPLYRELVGEAGRH